MMIALDFDETFTADPSFWLDFIENADASGHEVCICTIREPVLDAHPWLTELRRRGIKVYCCDGAPKIEFMKFKNVQVDIWIDDKPKTIIDGSAWKHGCKELEDWRIMDQERSKNLPPLP